LVAQKQEEAARNALAAAHRVLEMTLPGSFDDRASAVRDAELRERLQEGAPERRQPGHDRDRSVSQRLREPVRGPHRGGQEVRGPDDLPDHRPSLGAVGVEEPAAGAAAQDEIELPGEVPGVLQPRVHSLPAERAVDVGGIARHEEAADSQVRDVPVMNAEIAAPEYGARLDPSRRPLSKDLPDEVQ